MDSQFTPPMSAAYREAVGKFAERICVDPAHLLQSHPIDYEGVRFRFDHHGHIDPQGLLVVVERRAAVPLVSAETLRDPIQRAGLLTAGLVSTVMMATLVVGPFYLSRALGLAPVLVGAVMSEKRCSVCCANAGLPMIKPTSVFKRRERWSKFIEPA